MKSSLFSSLFVLLLGLLTALTPYYLFPVCEATVASASGASIPMKCFWMARAVLGQGIIVMFAGLVLAVFSSPGVRLGTGLMLLPISLVTALLSTQLVGVCASETMACHMGTLPAVCLLSLFTALCAAAIAWKARKNMVSLKHKRSP